MANTKHERAGKQQLGQFFTPAAIAEAMIGDLALSPRDRVLEPGFGRGAFLMPLIDRFMALRDNDLAAVLTENVWGIELDEELFAATIDDIFERWGELPAHHNLTCGDFLLESYDRGDLLESTGSLFEDDGFFDLIVGNPPFGGTVNIEHQDSLERMFGRRAGLKIKKETYSFFLVKSMDLVRRFGVIRFICSDTFLTISTMRGLRASLLAEGSCVVDRLDRFSEETSYPMVVVSYTRGSQIGELTVDGVAISPEHIRATANLSWRAGGEYAKYFGGPVIGDYLVATSGMTTGKNEFFVREVEADGTILESYRFEYVDEVITVQRELERARLNILSASQQDKIRTQESRGETRRNVVITQREVPEVIDLPNPAYLPYNKAQPGIVFTPPKFVIYWQDDGDAVLTYKRNGNWYLHGVGGQPYFLREGFTWKLISANIDSRYLPAGYILDSGAPAAFLRPGVDESELWFLMGWTLTTTASAILKNVLNHTMNIQGKDVERLPYPWWMDDENRSAAVDAIRDMVARAIAGERFTRASAELRELDRLYAMPDDREIALW